MNGRRKPILGQGARIGGREGSDGREQCGMTVWTSWGEGGRGQRNGAVWNDGTAFKEDGQRGLP